MTRRHALTEIAYPRLNRRPSTSELQAAFTPTAKELAFAAESTRQPGPRLALLVWLKVFQCVGYFPRFVDVPALITRYIASEAGLSRSVPDLAAFDESSYRARLAALVRGHLNIRPFDKAAANIAHQAAWEAALTRDDIPDIANAAIENLVEHRCELPEVGTLERAAKSMRAYANRNYHRRIATAIPDKRKAELDELLRVLPGDQKSIWDRVKAEPLRPTYAHLHQCIAQVAWLRNHIINTAFTSVPNQKVRQFAAEGRILDASDLKDVRAHRRYTLMAAVLRARLAENLNGLATMYIRLIQAMHNNAKRLLAEQKARQVEQTNELVALLRRTTVTWVEEVSVAERDAAVDGLLRPAEDIIAMCDAHAAVAGNNHIPFMLRLYGSTQRTVFFRFIQETRPTSTSSDHALEHALAFVMEHKSSRKVEIDITLNSDGVSPEKRSLDLSFIPDRWWPLVTGQSSRALAPTKINRHAFETCVFSLLANELKVCDLFIPGAIEFADYRQQMLSEQESLELTPLFAEQVGFPATAEAFVESLQKLLDETAREVDSRFPENSYVTLVDGKPKVARLTRFEHPGSRQLAGALTKELQEVSIVRPFIETEQWINWTRCFGPLTGFENKIERPAQRYLTVVFGYGCGLGPTQTSRSVKGMDRKHLAFIKARHITEQNLDEADRLVVGSYSRLNIHRHWGSGQSVSADGMKWEVHPQTLMTEYHLRYGGYGGIGYYIVSDTYIALFSRFIACGAYEGHNILDFIQEAQHTAFQPDTIHADTHGQNTAIFALAYLLGIKLMPRIKDWKDLDFCRPASDSTYAHIDTIFNAGVDWDLIREHFPDMIRVALSIKAGRLLPSTILRRLATYSRKNKLYLAFDQLGRVIRTMFLLRYMDSLELRRTIGIATNKSERWNKFLQWINFGGRGLVAEAARDEQRKMIKYNRTAGNLLVFHNAVRMSQGLDRLRAKGKGHLITDEAMAGISPYLTEHINRFGDYEFDMDLGAGAFPTGVLEK